MGSKDGSFIFLIVYQRLFHILGAPVIFSSTIEGSEDKDSSVSSGNSPRVTNNNEGGETKNINTRSLSNYPGIF